MVRLEKYATGEGNDYTNGCLLDYPYFKDNYTMIATDLNKQQALYTDPRGIQQINFTANLDKENDDDTSRIFSIIEEAKEIVLDFLKGTVKVL